MPALYVKATGSNTSPYDTWAKASTTLATAITAAAAGDIIYVHNGFTDAGANNTSVTFTPADNVRIISTSDTTNAPPLTYAAGAQFSTTGTGNLIIPSGEWFGFIFNASTGGALSGFTLCTTDNRTPSFEDCSFLITNTNTTSAVLVGPATSPFNTTLVTRNCSFQWGHISQGINLRTKWLDVGSNFDVGSVHPTTLFKSLTNLTVGDFVGSSFAAVTGTLFAAGLVPYVMRLSNCIYNATVNIQASLSDDGQGEVYLFDCHSGDTHYAFAHYSYRGTTVASTSKYVTADGASYDGTNRHSLTITGVNATFGLPYASPWIDAYTASTSAVTPYFETARDGSATKFTDGEVWAEFSAKTTSGSTRATAYNDRRGPLTAAASQATGAGTGAWTGLSGTAASQKCDSGASLTPQELGYVRGRIVIAINDTVYLDPNIRGLSETHDLCRVTPTGFINGNLPSAGGAAGMLFIPDLAAA